MSNKEAQEKAMGDSLIAAIEGNDVGMAHADLVLTCQMLRNGRALWQKEAEDYKARLLSAEAELAMFREQTIKIIIALGDDGKLAEDKTLLDAVMRLKAERDELKAEHALRDIGFAGMAKQRDKLRAELKQAKEAHRLQAANYTKLHDAIIGEGSSAGWPDPVEVAIELRTRTALLEKVMETARAGIGSCKHISDYIYGQYHATQGDLMLNRWRVNMKDALTALDQAEKGGGE